MSAFGINRVYIDSFVDILWMFSHQCDGVDTRETSQKCARSGHADATLPGTDSSQHHDSSHFSFCRHWCKDPPTAEATRWVTVLLLCLCFAVTIVDASGALNSTTSSDVTVKAISQLSVPVQSELVRNVKAATDGLQVAIQAISTQDVAKVMKEIGDVLAQLPGGFGYAGVAFSLAASAVSLVDADAIQSQLHDIEDQLSDVIVNIDRVLDGISDIPSKVVAEMKMTDISVMKDKFANVQRNAMLYAEGNLTRSQMISKCDDFEIPSLFSELETILKDEKDLFGAKFEAHDHADVQVQLHLLGFYISVIPVVANCNALKYSLESIQEDSKRMNEIIQVILGRAAWYLMPADRVVHMKEQFTPFATLFEVGEYHERGGYKLALSFKAYSLTPSHGECYQVTQDGNQLVPLPVDERLQTPSPNVFCVKKIATDDASQQIAYAERSDGSTAVSIIQPEVNGDFDALPERGWTRNAHTLFAPKFGEGYDRDGDGHSKDYKGAPWTIFCVRYVKRSIREIDAVAGSFLTDIQLNEMDPGKAWSAACPVEGYVRDKYAVTIPSKIKTSWLIGASIVKAYAVCLKWEPIMAGLPANHFVQRAWLDDSAAMPEKPKREWNHGEDLLALPRPPSLDEFTNF